jgi:hypothetical protein
VYFGEAPAALAPLAPAVPSLAHPARPTIVANAKSAESDFIMCKFLLGGFGHCTMTSARVWDISEGSLCVTPDTQLPYP